MQKGCVQSKQRLIFFRPRNAKEIYRKQGGNVKHFRSGRLNARKRLHASPFPFFPVLPPANGNVNAFFFYKNKLYKNTQADICPKVKNKLRTITRQKF